jgi:hypothetical protein
MGWQGVDIRQTGERLMFRCLLQDSSNAIVISGTTSLRLYEIQSDGTLKSYDFADDTFKTTALTTNTLAMTHRQGNNATYNTGIWTVGLATLTGFTAGGIYLAHVSNSGASPVVQVREFQFGGGQEDGSTLIIPDMATATNQVAIAEYIDTEVAAILDILQADRYIDTSQTPWQLVLIERGTGAIGVGTELLRQDLFDVEGGDVESIATFIGRQVAP